MQDAEMDRLNKTTERLDILERLSRKKKIPPLQESDMMEMFEKLSMQKMSEVMSKQIEQFINEIRKSSHHLQHKNIKYDYHIDLTYANYSTSQD